MTIRILSYLMGLAVMAFGITMAIRADIGVAPGSTISYAVSLLTPLTIGQCSSLFHVLCMAIQFAIVRRPSLKLIFQFPLAYLFGLLIDVFYALLDFTPSGIVHQAVLLVAGLFVFSFGIRVIVGADILLAPPDGLARTMGGLFGWKMGKSKFAFDVFITAFTMALTYFTVGDVFLVVGIGTVICALGTGPIIGLFTKLCPFFDFASR